MAKQSPKRNRAQREEEELERSYRKVSSSRKRTKKAQRGSRAGAVVAICIAMIAIAIGVFAACFYVTNNIEEGVILENVSIAGVDVGGMTKEVAIYAVQQATNSTYSQKNMVVR